MSLSNIYPTIRPSLLLDFANGGALDPRITFSRASSGTYFGPDGILYTAQANAPRFDYSPSTLAAQGLLIEEARTNGIRNNTMVNGSAGNSPTNWTANGTTGNGITVTVVGVGIENGIAYVDYEINGTATITGSAINIVFDTTTGIAASATQVWVWSSYLKLAAGTLTNLTFTPRISWRDSGGGALTSNDGTSVPTSAGLATQRYSFSATAPASTNYAQPQLRIGTVNGSTYTGVQIRIGMPQLELGAFATSVIPTTTTALTRAADEASVNTLSPWFNASEGTLFAEYSRLANVSGRIVTFHDTTSGEQIRINGSVSTDIRPDWQVIDGGAVQANVLATAQVAPKAIGKTAGVYKLDDFQQATNTSLGIADTSGSVPTVTVLQLGNNEAGSSSINGYLRRISYYPTRLPNAQLQSLTA